LAWRELVEKRGRGSRTYQNTEDTARHKLTAQTGTRWHYSSIADSGALDATVDMTPEHVVNTDAGLDIWRIENNGWQYALGQPADKNTDGWVGFGGRRGQNWFKFRLARLTYWNSVSRALTPVGGAPTYDRDNLTNEPQTVTVGPNDDEIVTESIFRWDNLWSGVDVQWRAEGRRLKEDVLISLATRQAIGSQYPGTAPSSTWFGLVFQVDWSDVPRRFIDGMLADPDDESETDGEIELRDAADNLLAFMPIDYVYVADENGDPTPFEHPVSGETIDRIPLRRRFWKDGDNHYLLVGLRCDVLNHLPMGPLVFDPTVAEQVTAGADDGYWTTTSNYLEAASGYNIYVGYKVSYDAPDASAWFALQDVTIPQGATIDSAYPKWYAFANLSNTSVNTNLCFADVDDASSPTTVSGADNMARTSVVAYDNVPAWTSGTWYTGPDVADALQEVVDRVGYESGNAVLMFWEDDGSTAASSTMRRPTPYEYNSSYATKLDVDYTEASSGVTGTSALTTEPAEVAATGDLKFSGTSALEAAIAELAATGSLKFSGTGTLTAEAAEVAGTGTVPHLGTAALETAAATLAATGNLRFAGTAALETEPAAVAGTASLKISGTSTLQTEPAEVAATGTATIDPLGGTYTIEAEVRILALSTETRAFTVPEKQGY